MKWSLLIVNFYERKHIRAGGFRKGAGEGLVSGGDLPSTRGISWQDYWNGLISLANCSKGESEPCSDSGRLYCTAPVALREK